jgi:DNA primase
LAKHQWIDFKAIRRELNFEQVLQHYGIRINARTGKSGKQHSGTCPLQSCRGKPPKRTFSANLERGIWQCFSCKASGNALDFIAAMMGLNPSKADELRQAAQKAKETFLGNGELGLEFQPAKPKVEEVPPEPPVEGARVLVNEPLDFELQSLDPGHPWFAEKKISRETVEHFGLGYCKRGWLKGRIAIPLRNGDGKLVGYAGRLLDDAAASEDNPLYAFPKARMHKGVMYEFRVSDLLYHRHDVKAPARRIFVTPFIETVWTLWQEGFQDAISIMGNVCHGSQRRAFIEATEAEGTVWIVSEERDFMSQSIAEITYLTAHHRRVRWCGLQTVLASASDFR